MATKEFGFREAVDATHVVPSESDGTFRRERLAQKSETRGAARVHSQNSAARKAEAGLVLMDSSLKPIYANSQAMQILAYPDNPRKTKSLESLLFSRIGPVVAGDPDSPQSLFPAEIVSGSRRYLCRTFVLNSQARNSSRPTVALLFERPTRRSVEISKVSEQYCLTRREREAVEFLIQGLSSKEIAHRMNISPNTVKAFFRLVMVKMGVSNRSGIMGKIIQATP